MTDTLSKILAELEAMLAEQDEPDFCHSPTREAYELARGIIEDAYARPLGAAPAPAAAPDGDGGLVVQWKAGKAEANLIIAPDRGRRSYIYSRGVEAAKVDYEPTGAVLAVVLHKTFGGL